MKTNNETQKGLRCSVLRAKGYEGCSMSGISSRFDTVTLIGEGVEGVSEPDADAPAVKLVKRNLGGVYVHAEPDLSHPSNAKELARIGSASPWLMAGGCYIVTSDSRFGRATGHSYPVSLHDRFEPAPQEND